MPRFIYKAKKTPTTIIDGKIEAHDLKDALNKLRVMGIFPLSVDEENPLQQQQDGAFAFFKKSVPLRDLSAFTRQLSNLLDSGMTLINALNVLTQQTENKVLNRIVESIKADIKDGISFSVALSKHGNVFSSLYVNMIKSGEVGGMLEAVLMRLADFIEKDEQTLSKIRTSMAYPALMASVGGLTIFILLSFVAPRLVSMFSDLGQALPLPTLILMSISGFFSVFWWLILLAGFFSFFVFYNWIKTKEGKMFFDRIKLNLPLISNFIKTSEFARLNRTLGTLIKNGVPIIEALDVLERTVDNEIIRISLQDVRKNVIDGLSLSEGLKRTGIYPVMMVNMINVGEESGSLEEALFKTADSYDMEVDRIVKIFTTLLEPILILALGVVVGFIVIAMLLPIFQINLVVR